MDRNLRKCCRADQQHWLLRARRRWRKINTIRSCAQPHSVCSLCRTGPCSRSPEPRPWLGSGQARQGLAVPPCPASAEGRPQRSQLPPRDDGSTAPRALLSQQLSLSFADNNIMVFPALVAGWEEPAAFGGIDPIDPRGSMSFPGDLLKKLLMSLFHFHQLITSCCCSLHFSSTCRNDSQPRSRCRGLSHGERGTGAECRGRVTHQGRSPALPLCRHAQTLSFLFSFFKGQPSSRLSNWSPGLTFKLRPL